MSQLRFYSGGKMVSLRAEPLGAIAPAPATRGRGPRAAGSRAMAAVGSQGARIGPMFHAMSESQTMAVVPAKADTSMVLVTETLVVDRANNAMLKHLRDQHGFEILREGSHAKVLLRAPEGGAKGVAAVALAARDTYERGNGKCAAHPNFVRVLPHTALAATAKAPHWNHLNSGRDGTKRGADVATRAAWTISKGSADVRVAILDEGVDTAHPALRKALAAERDFVDGNPTARPDGDDAHGTACAGIVLGRSSTAPGLAPDCKLVAARIAKGDGAGNWVFDDFDTADAIDWCWDDAGAAVLSNSWGGGPPVDAITNAFERARRQGRGGKGSVIACATGNDNGAIGYPATLANVLSVGASTPWDERKSPTSLDGETWWGSNFGTAIDLVAPGVWIACSDIRGAAGYDPSAYTKTFNGTSAATPHVAAAAALVISVAPHLGEADVRRILVTSCDKVTSSGQWDKFVGHGRLNLHAALRLALR